MGLLQSHISQHVHCLQERKCSKNAQVIQEQAMQFGGQLPPQLTTVSTTKEKEITEKITQLTNDGCSRAKMMNIDKKTHLLT